MTIWWILSIWGALAIIVGLLAGRFIKGGYGDDDDDCGWWDL